MKVFYRDFTKKTLRALLICISGLAIAACSLDASIEKLTQDLSDPVNQSRTQPDFIYGEFVTTSAGHPGYQVKAVFGEVSEKTVSLTGNQWKIEGAFYE